MEHLIQYTWKTKEVFYNYLTGKMELEDMIEVLRGMEQHAGRDYPVKERKNKEMWYKFFEGDTGTTSIYEIKAILGAPGPNAEHLRESMRMGVSSVDGLQIYYS